MMMMMMMMMMMTYALNHSLNHSFTHLSTPSPLCPVSLYLHTAGDCRAVMGRRESNGMYGPVQLTNDHNVRSNKAEIEALKAAHPGEDDLIVCPYPDVCYIKNRSQATRTLGDAYLKCAEFNGRAGGRGAQRRYM